VKHRVMEMIDERMRNAFLSGCYALVQPLAGPSDVKAYAVGKSGVKFEWV